MTAASVAQGNGEVRYRPAISALVGTFIGVAILLLALGLPLLIAGVFALGWISVAFGAVVTTMGLLFAGLVLLILRPVRLTSEALSIPVRRHPTVIPVQEIAGVGLAFKQSEGPAYGSLPIGWYLMVWRNDGTGERTAISWLPTRFKKASGKVTLNAFGFDPVSGTDPSQLERTHAAQCAKGLYARVLEMQGPRGPLATKELQKHPQRERNSISPITAYWSPDGDFGRASV